MLIKYLYLAKFFGKKNGYRYFIGYKDDDEVTKRN